MSGVDTSTRPPVRVELHESESDRLEAPGAPTRSRRIRAWLLVPAVVALVVVIRFDTGPARSPIDRFRPVASGPERIVVGVELSELSSVTATFRGFRQVDGDLTIVDVGPVQEPPIPTDLPSWYSPRGLIADAHGYLTWGGGVDARDRLFASDDGERWTAVAVDWPTPVDRAEIVTARRGGVGTVLSVVVAEADSSSRPAPRVFILPESPVEGIAAGRLIELPSPCPPLERCPVTSLTAEDESVVAMHRFRTGLPRTVSAWSPGAGWTPVIGPVLPDSARLGPGTADRPIVVTDGAVYELDLLAETLEPLVDAPPGVGGRVAGASDSGRVVAFERGPLIMVYSQRSGRWASFRRDTFDSYDLVAVSEGGALYSAVGPYGAEVVFFPAP